MSGYDVREDDLLHKLPRTDAGLPRAGKVVIQDRLGKGGMGAVYLGRDTKLNVPVAVKVIPFHLVEANPDFVERFQREAQAAAQVDHPNLMRVYTVDEDRGVHYLVLEFVDGESAAERLKREGPLPEADALEICIAAGDALAAAHAEGIIHRDVKPANVMIRHKDGRVKLADLGLAKSFHEDTSRQGGLTATGQVMGTPAFMSPEQARDASQVDPRTDVYSLGATLYALLTGRAPHDATQLLALLMKVTSEEPEDLGRIRPELNDATCDVVRRMMAKEPQDRIATMAGAVAAMKGAREGPGVSSKGLARPQLAGSRPLAAAAAPTPAPSTSREVGRTLEDVTPADIARQRPTEPMAGPAPTAATVPVVAGMSAGKKLAVALGILAALGAAAGAGGYLHLRKKAEEERRGQIAALVAEASDAERADDLDGAARLFEEAAALGDERARIEAQRVRKTLADRREAARLVERARKLSVEEALPLVERALALDRSFAEARELRAELGKRAKVEALLKEAASLREAGKLEGARSRAAEALSLDAQNTELKALLASVEKEIGRRQAEAKVAAVIAASRTFREAGLFEKAREKLVEALSVIPEHAEAKRMLREIQAEIAGKEAEAERAADFRKWMDRGFQLRTTRSWSEAAEAFERAARYEKAGLHEARDAAAGCMHEQFKAQAMASEGTGDFAVAIKLYEKALEKKDDPSTRKALGEAREKLGAKRAEEAKRAEATERAEEAKRRGDLDAALRWYEEAARHGAVADQKIAALKKEIARRTEERRAAYTYMMSRARSLIAEQQWKEAVQALEAALNHKPGDTEATELLSKARQEARKTARIVVLYCTFSGSGDCFSQSSIAIDGVRAPLKPGWWKLHGRWTTIYEARIAPGRHTFKWYISSTRGGFQPVTIDVEDGHTVTVKLRTIRDIRQFRMTVDGVPIRLRWE